MGRYIAKTESFFGGIDPSEMTQAERVGVLTRFYCEVLAEDTMDGTMFDANVLDALRDVSLQTDST